MINISIGGKSYKVHESKTEEERRKGLKEYQSLPEDEGMLFCMPDESQQQIFTMKGMNFPIDIIYINQDSNVIDVKADCQPGQDNIINSIENMEPDDYIEFVLEVNPNSGIQINDTLEFESEDSPVMRVLAQDGSTQMDLYGGERIFRRAFTKQIIRLAKQADLVKDISEDFDKICKRIGKKMFKEIKAQDNRPAEYVKGPKKD